MRKYGIDGMEVGAAEGRDQGTPLTGGGGSRQAAGGSAGDVGGSPKADPGQIRPDVTFTAEEPAKREKGVAPGGHQPRETESTGSEAGGPGGTQAGGAHSLGGGA